MNSNFRCTNCANQEMGGVQKIWLKKKHMQVRRSPINNCVQVPICPQVAAIVHTSASNLSFYDNPRMYICMLT